MSIEDRMKEELLERPYLSQTASGAFDLLEDDYEERRIAKEMDMPVEEFRYQIRKAKERRR